MRRLWLFVALTAGCGAPAATAARALETPAPIEAPAPPPRAEPDAKIKDPGDCAGPGCQRVRPRIVITSCTVEILGPIHFAADDVEMHPDGRRVLDAIARTLDGNPDIRRVEVQGHADAEDLHPVEISLARAEAVRQLLIRRGVAGARLSIRAMGTKGLSKRTVEFLILDRN